MSSPKKVRQKFAQLELQPVSDSVNNIFSKWDKRNLLREKYPYSELFWSVRSISPHSVLMRENTNQNNSEYGHFLRNEPSAYQNAKQHSLTRCYNEQNWRWCSFCFKYYCFKKLFAEAFNILDHLISYHSSK